MYFDQVDPNGMSYAHIIDKCLSFHDRSFAVWMSTLLNSLSDECFSNKFFFREVDAIGNPLYKKQLDQNELLLWAKEENHQMIIDALSHHLIKDINCTDPQSGWIFSLPSMGSNELSKQLRSKLIWLGTLFSIKENIRYTSVTEVAVKGGNPGELSDLTYIYKQVCDSLEVSDIYRPSDISNKNINRLEMEMHSEFTRFKKSYFGHGYPMLNVLTA